MLVNSAHVCLPMHVTLLRFFGPVGFHKFFVHARFEHTTLLCRKLFCPVLQKCFNPGIPEFWLTAIKNCDIFVEFVKVWFCEACLHVGLAPATSV